MRSARWTVVRRWATMMAVRPRSKRSMACSMRCSVTGSNREDASSLIGLDLFWGFAIWGVSRPYGALFKRASFFPQSLSNNQTEFFIRSRRLFSDRIMLRSPFLRDGVGRDNQIADSKIRLQRPTPSQNPDPFGTKGDQLFHTHNGMRGPQEWA